MIAPFGLLLAGMALGPLLFQPWWVRHYGKAAVALGAITAGYYLCWLPPAAARTVGRAAHNYLGFIALVGSLYVVSGGIHIRVKEGATPGGNVIFLLVGALLANVLGTVGASLLLIRPWLAGNRLRLGAHHVIFFIFLVCNVGGCLTAFGNPPLFLGCLMGIPPWWVAQRCWPMWLCGVGFLLAVFYLVDRRHAGLTPVAAPNAASAPWAVQGLWNLVFLGIILAAIFVKKPDFLSEGLMLAAAAASYLTTPQCIHKANQFDFHPLGEVAVLFLGIFATMLPALDWLQLHARTVLGAEPSSGAVFWASGILSSLLDNAPTYLSFLTALFGTQGQSLGHPAEMARLLQREPLRHAVAALSVGAVFFGGCTYIGNGPNFIVKAIAEKQHIPLPGFVGYILKWAVPVMLPLLVMIWILFFR